MRLLHVHSGNLYGGVETMLLTIARHARAAPLEHEFALCFEGRLARELRASGAPPHLLGAARVRSPLSILRARRRLRELLRDLRFDAAVCHMPWAQALFARTVRAVGRPQLFWMHEVAAGRHWLERWARRSPPDMAICNSHYTATTLPRLYPDSACQVLYPPVELTRVPPDPAQRIQLRRQFDTPAEAIVIVQVGRLQPGKGHLVHLEAAGRLRANPKWVCWIVGGAQQGAEARYRATLETRAVALGIADRVRFCGERADVPYLLGAADIFCQPNTRPEAFGIVFVEALNSRLPVVTSGFGGPAEIIDSSCGVSVPPNDSAQLANVLHSLIEDTTLRTRLGEVGPARAALLCDPRARLAELAIIVAGVAESNISPITNASAGGLTR